MESKYIGPFLIGQGHEIVHHEIESEVGMYTEGLLCRWQDGCAITSIKNEKKKCKQYYYFVLPLLCST